MHIPEKSAILKIGAATIAFAIFHSLLASLGAKRMASRLVGERRRDAFYRSFFVLQSLASFSLLVVYALKLPGRLLYRVKGLPAWILRLGQLSGIVYAVYAAYHAGILRMTGLDGLLAWLRGSPPPPFAVAQGPERQAAADFPAVVDLPTGGPFRWSRHPLNFAPLPAFWLTPVMTTRRLVFNLIGTLYLVLGSLHEERRLRQVYGAAYEEYTRSGVPFYWPRFRSL